MMKCTFCGCTDGAACMIPVDGDGNIRFGVDPNVNLGDYRPCGWLIKGECCTAPACVEQAYELIGWIPRELAARARIKAA